MAQDLDDGEFWLPPQFLTDDDLLQDFKKNISNSQKNCGGPYVPYEFPTGFGSVWPNSDLSSPVESVVGSTETESDEEEYLTGLTRKLAQSTLEDDVWKSDSALVYEKSKSWAISSSPQSTLCSVLSGGFGCKNDSSRGSTHSPSLVSSPQRMNWIEPAWDLLHAAAGEVARMKMIEQKGNGFYQNGGMFAPPRKPDSVVKNTVPSHLDQTNVEFYSNQSISYQQLQATQFEQLKRQQMLKQQVGTGVLGHQASHQQRRTHQIVQNSGRNGCGARPLGLSMAAWPTLQQSQQQQQQQQPGSGMRAVFLGNHGSKRECAGTGVFLPRRIGTPTETRKKPVCSTVLLPDRVVHALNLKLDPPMDTQHHLQSRHTGHFSPDYDDSALNYRNNMFMAQQRRNVRAPPVLNQEVRLPHEWTY